MISSEGYWFTSTTFEVEPGEDSETNPRKYGRQLAKWLRDHLVALGYPAEEVFGDDWGWCVMCRRDPYLLWVGCVNLQDQDHAKPDDPPPSKHHLLWNVVPMAEVPFFRYLLRPKPNVQPGLQQLDSELRRILETAEGIEIVEDSTADKWFDNLRKQSVHAVPNNSLHRP
jgi:hypothetical protein